jgi:peptidyl-prolyl cis-trans isomerase A (cyclophilin A)
MQQKPTHESIKNEATNGLSNDRGTLAMARRNDIDSATSQFYINTRNNAMLDHRDDSYGYAVFGKVIEGMDVVDKIEGVPTTTRKMPDVPVEPVVITSVKPR